MAKVKILKSGETDIESADIWRFSVHSDYPLQKIAVAGSTTLTIPSGQTYGSKTLNHSLGYAPTVMAMFPIYGGNYVKVNGQKKTYRPVDNEAQIYSVVSTSSSVTFRADANISTSPAGSNINLTIYYMFLYEDV